jgi:hypothetical protein
MALPADLLGAIAHEDGGRVVLVIGAGCSIEAPTGLPLASACAEEAHRKLVEDGILNEGDCPDPSDLSCLADAVRDGQGSQRPLVERMPLTRFRNAEPNEGHLLAAAMMREFAVKAVVTLNFDLAVSTALASLGNKEAMILTGPQDHHRMGAVNLVYLHRNVDAAPDDWILSTEALDNAWRGQWEELVTAAMLTSPVTVFAGLGTPASVLVESTRKIRDAIPEGVNAFHVDPGEAGTSAFSAALEIPDEHYIQSGWIDFMRGLASRLAAEHRNAVVQAAARVCADEGLESEDVVGLCDQLVEPGLVETGRLRARWMLEETRYQPHRSVDPRYIANLLLGIALIQRTLECNATLDAGGLVVFEKDGQQLGKIRLACGRGLMGWLALEARLRHAALYSPKNETASSALVAGVGARPPTVSPPEDITSDVEEESIVVAGGGLRILSVEDLRIDPTRVTEVLG